MLAGLFFSREVPNRSFRRSRDPHSTQTRVLVVGALGVALDFGFLLHPIGDLSHLDDGGQMKLNQAAQELLDAFLEKRKAEDRLLEAEVRLARILSQPKPAPIARRF